MLTFDHRHCHYLRLRDYAKALLGFLFFFTIDQPYRLAKGIKVAAMVVALLGWIIYCLFSLHETESH
jgi:hypothetical protein